ncbi:MAG TPA: alpha-galactosidase [Candidatus Hydrogenedentes bacterium]|nr:alpha-galactosidase [Candidatus Hydrogenedentota bacterium]
MRKSILLAILALLGLSSALQAEPPTATPDEMAEAQRWAGRFDGAIEPQTGEPGFSFLYGGKPSAELLSAWTFQRTSRRLDAQRTEHALSYEDPQSKLLVRWVAVSYNDFPVVEWTAWLKNNGKEDTSLIEGLQGLDVSFPPDDLGGYVLRGSTGDHNVADSYAPYEVTLWPNTKKTFAPDGGRPCDTAFPYFNLAMPNGKGMIMAVGWTGQWAATFWHRADRGLQVTAGQELTRLYLEPGEEIRTPLIALMFWEGNDVVRAQNLWRRWMFAHNLPHPGGKPLRPLLTFCDYGFYGWAKNTEEGEKLFIDELTRQGIQLDYWWVDAGWFPGGQGEWVVAKDRFPNGLKAISDYVHERNMGLIVWFEPESAYPWSITARNNPQAMLKSMPPEPYGLELLYLGDLKAREWITNHIDTIIRDEGVDFYRQDMNLSPLSYWRGSDAPNRLGIHENLHVQGYLAFWDELLRRHPGMPIDSCAGGGRRNDIETLRRAIPLLRSDYQDFQGHPQWAIGNQGHTYGIASWIPYFGTGVYYNPQQTIYSVRSYMTPALGLICDVRNEEVDWDLYRRMIGQWRQVADSYLGDYYPLTPYSLDEKCWLAWQFNRPEQGDGMVQAFRRKQTDADSFQAKLHGLDPGTTYTVTDLDTSATIESTGRELMDRGVSIPVADEPGAALLRYQRKQ